MSKELTDAIVGMDEDEAMRLVGAHAGRRRRSARRARGGQGRDDGPRRQVRVRRGLHPRAHHGRRDHEGHRRGAEAAHQGRGGRGDRGTIVLGTVAGDIHDIGKDVVVLMLDVNGYDVHDLGIDVPVEKFVAAIDELKPQVVGLSGLLTLAFDSMKATIDGIAAAGLRDQVKIMIGGSPVDEQICTYTGADGWGRDAAAALRMAAEWTGECGMTPTPEELYAQREQRFNDVGRAQEARPRARHAALRPQLPDAHQGHLQQGRRLRPRDPLAVDQGGDAPLRLELRADQRRPRLRLLRRLRQQADHVGRGGGRTRRRRPVPVGRGRVRQGRRAGRVRRRPQRLHLQQDPAAHGLQARGPRPDPAAAAVLVLQQLLPAGARQHARHPAAQGRAAGDARHGRGAGEDQRRQRQVPAGDEGPRLPADVGRGAHAGVRRASPTPSAACAAARSTCSASRTRCCRPST